MSSFFGIATDAANEPYKHDMLYLGNDETFIYWQDNRWGESKIMGQKSQHLSMATVSISQMNL